MASHHRPAPLGEFELLVLLATLTLGEDAYPVSVAREIETRTGRKASRTAVLITLERLEEKELVSSRYGGATAERGGRPKRFFKTKARGVQAVRDSLERIRTLATGLEALIERR
ncbi:MAG: PadR family transcriptional regulator [Vicinamibacterales bacterium]